MNYKLMLSLRSQFFHIIFDYLSSQVKLRSTIQRLGIAFLACRVCVFHALCIHD